MATTQSTAEFLMDQVTEAGEIRIRKMFGEYALYCNEKVVALICDDHLYLKPTEEGRAIIGNVKEAPPYPGAKQHFLIDEEKWDDREWLAHLIATTAQGLPAPKPKRR